MNYFSYFSEVEEHFQRRRGTLLLLSTLDWALIETWREAGIPLEAVLRGIDAAFDKRDSHPSRSRLRAVNGLAWCSQAVLEQAAQMQEAAVGTATDGGSKRDADDGFDRTRVQRHLQECLDNFAAADVNGLQASVERIRELAAESADATQSLESLENKLTVLEERVFATLMTATCEDELVRMRETVQRELAPHRGKMQAAQIAQVQRQMLHKRLLEAHALPRLSLFYMAHE